MNIFKCHKCDSRTKVCNAQNPCLCLVDKDKRNIAEVAEKGDCPLGYFSHPQNMPKVKTKDDIGKAMWLELHEYALELHTEEQDKNWLDSFAKRLPNGCHCRDKWPNVLKSTPPPYGQDLFPWTVDIHDKINQELKKFRFYYSDGKLDYNLARKKYTKNPLPDGFSLTPEKPKPEAIIESLAKVDGLPTPTDNRPINGNLSKEQIYNLFDAVYVINLKRRKERLDQFNRHIADLKGGWPFKPITVFEAVDGDAEGKNSTWGCRESHAKVLKYAIEQGQTNILILEDDAYFTDDFSSKITEFLSKVPEWDGLWLGNEHRGNFEKATTGVLRATNPHRLHAYALRGKALKSMFDWLAYGPKASGYHDWWLDHADHVTGEMLGKNYQIYFPDPILVAQRGGYSDIRGQVKPFEWFGEAPKMLPYIGNDKVIYLKCPRNVREELRGLGLHGGYNIVGDTGVDQWLNVNIKNNTENVEYVFDMWLDVIRNEAAMSGKIPCVWYPDLPQNLVEKLVNLGAIFIDENDTLSIRRKLDLLEVPLPDTANKIFAVVGIRNGGLELLPHWLKHYTNLGADKLLLGIFPDVTQESKNEIDSMCHGYPVVYFNQTWMGKDHSETEGRNEEERRTACRENGALPSTWVIHTDLDEFQTYPAPLNDVIDAMNERKQKGVFGNFCDRVSIDGGLPEVKSDISVFHQYPYGTKLTKNILEGGEWKIMIAKYSVRTNIGHHDSPNYSEKSWPIGTLDDYKVHHFKWTKSVLERMQWGLSRTQAHPAWLKDTRMFLEWFEANDNKILLDDPKVESRLLN
jgi:hypothetical protein